MAGNRRRGKVSIKASRLILYENGGQIKLGAAIKTAENSKKTQRLRSNGISHTKLAACCKSLCLSIKWEKAFLAFPAGFP